ncbi:MAG: 50S ribosomal protein L32 [Chloroflexota bacterium]|nr:MAG: 50S ribosomal protein L32 [Chloroflexota bacterium]
MGAQPKKKVSHAKKNSRRSQDAIALSAIILCSHCRRPHVSHHVCTNCGYYAGREVIADERDRTGR